MQARSVLPRLALVVVSVLWLVAAALLLRTTVPADLELPAVDVDAVFGADLVDRAERYERGLYALWLVSNVAVLVVLWLYARRGTAFMRESAAGPIGTGMLLGMLGLALVWFVELPFSLAWLWWDRRHGVSEVGYLDWVFGGPIELAATFLSICAALLIVMGLARLLGDWWWIPGAGVFVAIAMAFSFGLPYLSDLERVTDPSVQAAYDELATSQRVDDVPLRVENVSGDTSQANAYAFGVGPSRRIVVWDTLMDGRFTDREVRVVLAHELGHHAGAHLTKALAWFGLFSLPGAWVLMRVTRRRGGMAQAEAVPLALLTAAIFGLAVMPAQSWISRGIEADADWRALRATNDAEAARGLFVRFSATSLGDPDPPTWATVVFGSHPTLARRVAMANAWDERPARPEPE